MGSLGCQVKGGHKEGKGGIGVRIGERGEN